MPEGKLIKRVGGTLRNVRVKRHEIYMLKAVKKADYLKRLADIISQTSALDPGFRSGRRVILRIELHDRGHYNEQVLALEGYKIPDPLGLMWKMAERDIWGIAFHRVSSAAVESLLKMIVDESVSNDEIMRLNTDGVRIVERSAIAHTVEQSSSLIERAKETGDDSFAQQALTLLAGIPTTPMVLIRRALALKRLERYEEAEVCLRKALRIDPRNAMVLATMGLLLTRMGRHEEAIPFIMASLKNSSRPCFSLRELAVTYYKEGKYGLAVEWLRQIRRRGVDEFWVYNLEGDCLRKLGNYVEAISVYEAALLKELSRDDRGRILNSLAYSYLERGKQLSRPASVEIHYKKAQQTFERALSRNSASNKGRLRALNGLAYLYRKWADMYSGKKRQHYIQLAISYYKKVLELDPSDVRAKSGKENLERKLN